MDIKAKRVKEGFLIPSTKKQGNSREIKMGIKEEIKVDINASREVNNIAPIEASFCDQISALFSKFPSKIIDWEKEWQMYIEWKYNG